MPGFLTGLVICLLPWRVMGQEESTHLRVGYLAESPVSWRSNLMDPEQSIARSLSSAFGHPVDLEYPLPGKSLVGSASWEEFLQTIREGEADLFPMQSYDLVEHGGALKLKPLLLATRNGIAQTSFVLLASRNFGIVSLRDLQGRTILVHRDGCGSLVDYWLDSAIATGTGTSRKSFARFQTVAQAREAVLPVFFGEAEACVVSEAAWKSIAEENPAQIRSQLRSLEESAKFPTQVVACHVDLKDEAQSRVLQQASLLTWDFGEGNGGFIRSEEDAFVPLLALFAERKPDVGATLSAMRSRSSPPVRPVPAHPAASSP